MKVGPSLRYVCVQLITSISAQTEELRLQQIANERRGEADAAAQARIRWNVGALVFFCRCGNDGRTLSEPVRVGPPRRSSEACKAVLCAVAMGRRKTMGGPRWQMEP